MSIEFHPDFRGVANFRLHFLSQNFADEFEGSYAIFPRKDIFWDTMYTWNIYALDVTTKLQGVPQYWAHLAFCYFVSFYSTKIQKLGLFEEIQEIC